jgi:transposase
MEACVGAHHLSRQLLALGHDVKLVPGQFVKPFLSERNRRWQTVSPAHP